MVSKVFIVVIFCLTMVLSNAAMDIGDNKQPSALRGGRSLLSCPICSDSSAPANPSTQVSSVFGRYQLTLVPCSDYAIQISEYTGETCLAAQIRVQKECGCPAGISPNEECTPCYNGAQPTFPEAIVKSPVSSSLVTCSVYAAQSFSLSAVACAEQQRDVAGACGCPAPP